LLDAVAFDAFVAQAVEALESPDPDIPLPIADDSVHAVVQQAVGGRVSPDGLVCDSEETVERAGPDDAVVVDVEVRPVDRFAALVGENVPAAPAEARETAPCSEPDAAVMIRGDRDDLRVDEAVLCGE